MTSYHAEYDGYYTMKWHDDEENLLKRWFENYKIDKFASFAWETECLIVKEIKFKNKVRYICEIEDEGRNTKREVIIDHTAPKPPLLTFAAKKRYIAPPPKTAAELRKEAEFNRMMMLGFEPVYRRKPIYRPISCISDIPGITTMDYEVVIEWVKMKRDRFAIHDYDYIPYKPVIPKHRRNV